MLCHSMRLLKKVAAALNRSGSQLRKERKKKCDIKQIIRLDLSAFHIHQIADGAECVKDTPSGTIRFKAVKSLPKSFEKDSIKKLVYLKNPRDNTASITPSGISFSFFAKKYVIIVSTAIANA